MTLTSSDGVDIGTANTTAFDCNIDVTIFERFQFELIAELIEPLTLQDRLTDLLLFEVLPFLLVLDHKALSSIWIRHFFVDLL